MKKYIGKKKYVSCDELARIFTKDYETDISMNDIHRLVDPYCRKHKGSLIKINGEWFYDTATIYNLRCYGENAVEFVNKIKNNKQKEDDLEYMPNVDKESIDKWYRPNSIKINESQYKRLFEGVYVNKIKGNKAMLTYDQDKRKKNNLKAQDFLGTEKMDENNTDTYEVTLKGGITSYNITSIKGTEVMHYFKKLWDNKDTTMKIGDNNYQLSMLSKDFQNFKKQFLNKVGIVIDYCLSRFKTQNKNTNINSISIYPVKSSSNFNIKMCQEISNDSISGLKIRIVNENLFTKELKNLEKDEDFINKNKDYYNSSFFKVSDGTTTINHVDKDLARYKQISYLGKYIDEMNTCAEELISLYYHYNQNLANNRKMDKVINRIVELYKHYCDCFNKVNKESVYQDPLKNGDDSSIHFEHIANAIKYTKGPSVETRSGIIWSIVKPYLRGMKSPVNGKPYTLQPLNFWEKNKFQIKNLTNGERMAMRNYYEPNDDTEIVMNEVNAAKNSVFVIFDDNVSGGATLSDICYQCQKLGIENIIPITFGKMDTKTTMNFKPLTLPTNKNGEEDFNY